MKALRQKLSMGANAEFHMRSSVQVLSPRLLHLLHNANMVWFRVSAADQCQHATTNACQMSTKILNGVGKNQDDFMFQYLRVSSLGLLPQQVTDGSHPTLHGIIIEQEIG